ncbi:MAG: haloacid dehalogenase-like hydrolase [Microlunatus sp.]
MKEAPRSRWRWSSRSLLRRRVPTVVAASALLFGGLMAGGVADSAAASPSRSGHSLPEYCRQLDPSLTWQPGVREFLQSAIDKNSTCRGAVRHGKNKVAIFDWDDTIVKNGIGYVTNYYTLQHDLVLQPKNRDWRTLNRYLTDDAAHALTKACGTKVRPGKRLPTSTNEACTAEIVALLDGKTVDGKVGFTGYNARWIEPSYLWSAALLSGYTERQIAGFAAQVRQQMLTAPIGTTQHIGGKNVTGYIRYYEQMRDLVGTLTANGITPWVVSASPEPLVKVWAPGAGFDVRHVVGIRSVYDRHGRQTPHLKGCGGTADGDDAVLPYIDGKRCWANQAIFGVRGAKAFDQLSAKRRQVLAGGDSVTDVTFVGDATSASLAINRNKPELMCRAYDGLFTKGGKWAVNPMFINPLPQHAPYQCSQAYANPDGSFGPVLRADGSVIEDQIDSVHG